MLENGMIIGAESYDPQCREVAQGKCAHCKQTVPVYELTEFANGERAVSYTHLTLPTNREV